MRDGRRTAAGSRWIAFAAVGALSVGAALWVNGWPDGATASAPAVTSGATVGPATAPGLREAVAGSAGPADALPASLAGSAPPRLPTDGRGHLLRVHGVRDFFDYFLTTQGEMSSHALDALVRRQIAAQLDGTAAAGEAVDVWQRYGAYLNALAQAPQPQARSDGNADFDALQLALDQRAVLGTRWLGEWDAPFFGAQAKQQRTDLARLRITADSSLTDAQKAARIALLDTALPPEARAARERVRQQQAALDAVAQAQGQVQASGASADAVRAQITQTLGPEAAERVVQMQKDDAAWQVKYADYASRRAQIEQQDVPPPQRDAQIVQLRQQMFANPGDALRAASLDRGAGG